MSVLLATGPSVLERCLAQTHSVNIVDEGMQSGDLQEGVRRGGVGSGTTDFRV